MTHGKARRSGEKERLWRQVVEGHAGSGQSIRRYCTERGVSQASFFAWRRELARRDAAAKRLSGTSSQASPRPAPQRFAQLQIVPGELARDDLIEILLPAGALVRVPRGVCQGTLSRVLGALERRPC